MCLDVFVSKMEETHIYSVLLPVQSYAEHPHTVDTFNVYARGCIDR